MGTRKRFKFVGYVIATSNEENFKKLKNSICEVRRFSDTKQTKRIFIDTKTIVKSLV